MGLCTRKVPLYLRRSSWNSSGNMPYFLLQQVPQGSGRKKYGAEGKVGLAMSREAVGFFGLEWFVLNEFL